MLPDAGPMDANGDVTPPPPDAGIVPDASASDAPRDTAPQDAPQDTPPQDAPQDTPPQDTAPVDTAACPAICNAGCAGGTCKMVDPGDGLYDRCPWEGHSSQ